MAFEGAEPINMKNQKSEFVKIVDDIQSSCENYLISIGFKRKKRLFNRYLDNNLVQVISFQLGERSMYGELIINVGVHIPEIFAIEYPQINKQNIDETCCEIRARISAGKDNEEKWWRITKEKNSIILKFFPSLHQRKIRKIKVEILEKIKIAENDFFKEFETREKIVAYFNQNRSLPFHNEMRSKLAVAIIESNWDSSANTLEKLNEIAQNSDHTGFKNHINKVAAILCGNSVKSSDA